MQSKDEKKPKGTNRILAVFGDNLLRFRKKSDLTQQELAGAVGLSRVMIANLEAGINATSIEHLLKICAVLKVTPNEILPAVPKVTLKKVVIGRRIVKKESLTADFKF